MLRTEIIIWWKRQFKLAKVIIIGPAFPYRGGIATFNDRLAKAFQDRGDEVEIHTFSLQYPSFLFPGKTQFSDKAAPEGIKIVRSINSVNPFNWIKIGNKISKLDLSACPASDP